MERARAERPHDQALDALRTQRTLEFRRLAPLDESPASRRLTGLAPRRRTANASARDEDESSHRTSSTAIRDGPPLAQNSSASRTATASA